MYFSKQAQDDFYSFLSTKPFSDFFYKSDKIEFIKNENKDEDYYFTNIKLSDYNKNKLKIILTILK